MRLAVTVVLTVAVVIGLLIVPSMVQAGGRSGKSGKRMCTRLAALEARLAPLEAQNAAQITQTSGDLRRLTRAVQ